MAEINIEKEAQNVAKKVIQDLRDNGVFIGRWIPVSERLPKIGERVMVTLQHEFEEETVEITTYSKHGFYIQPVVSWMPLPEPYKAESGE